MKKLATACLFSFSLACFGQGSQLPKYTVATLPSASSYPTYTVQVIDGASANDCSTGGGSYNVICVAHSGSWVPAAGGVTAVSGTAPVQSSGGTTPAISMHVADGSDNGYLLSADWTTFNGKQAALSLVKGTYVDGDLCGYAASGTFLNCNIAPGGTGNMSDGSGTATPGDFPVTTSTPHSYGLDTPSQVLAAIGGASAVSCTTVSSLAPANGGCYNLSTSSSVAMPAASTFSIFRINTASGATATFTGVTLTSDAGCSNYLSGSTLSLTANQSAVFTSDLTNIWASCTVSASGSGTVSGQAAGVVPLATNSTTIGGQSALSDNGVNVTSSEPIEAPIYPTTYLLSVLYNGVTTGPQTFASLDAVHVQPVTKSGGAQLYTTSAFRDPRILKVGNTYFLSYTAASFTAVNHIGLAYSTDMQNWTTATTPDWSAYFVGGENIVSNGCWYYDSASGVYYLFFGTYTNSGPAGTGYYVTFNPAAKTFGTPQLITLSPSRTTSWPMAVFKIGSTYYYLLQSYYSSTGYVELADSSSISATTLTIIGAANWAGWNTTVPSIESGAMIVTANGNYEALFNTQPSGAVYYSTATPGAGNPTTWTWSAPTVVNTGGISVSNIDWVDVVPFSDIQTDQVLNALLRANPVPSSSAAGGAYVNLGSVVSATGCTISGPPYVCTVGTAASSITISSIPTTYLNLEISLFGINNQTATEDVLAQFNGDTGSNYDYVLYYSSGANNPQNGNAHGATSAKLCNVGQTGSYTGGGKITVTGYANTTFFKTATGYCGSDGASAGYQLGVSYFATWKSTAAITSVTLSPSTGTFTAGDTVAIYGTD